MAETERIVEKIFANGDIYAGQLHAGLPHGIGKYTWADGTVYEGEWERGKLTGKGKLLWSSGARYEGDFSGGYLHGFGTLTAVEGSVYRGAWRMNIRHGLGRKEYSNSDVYDGSWKEGVQEGSGTYSWRSGNTYIGNWKAAKMTGRGVMKWANGDIYDGFWLNGYRHGSGVYKFVNGDLYFGTWTRGLKDGKGIYYPAGAKHPSLKKWCKSLGYDDSGNFVLSRSSSINLEDLKTPRPSVVRSRSAFEASLKNSGRISRGVSGENWGLGDLTEESSCNGSSSRFSMPLEEVQSEVQGNNTLVYEREYMQGVVIKERVLSHDELSRKSKQRPRSKDYQRGTCVPSFAAKQNYYLMLSLQLGIRYTVGKITPVPSRKVRASDFGDRARITMFFPKDGSQLTPPHRSIDFYWKDYCPMVFRNLREMFKLDAAEYMMSICGGDGLREISSPGKSGSIFYLSHDDRFVIKTLKRPELKVLLRMLPSYYEHVGKHENTLITKFFGVHRIKLKYGRKVRFVVMGNMFCTELKIHRRYDLKGSSQGRWTEKEKIEEKTTLKDLDLSYEIYMDKLLREYLFRQIDVDCQFLESQHIIDYSLLLGIHFRGPEQLNGILQAPASLLSQGSAASSGELSIPPRGLLLVTHEPSSVNTAPGPHIRGKTLKAYSVGEKEVDLLLPGTARLRVQLGVNMPAQANRKLCQEDAESAEVELFEVYDVVLYMGIIDILQDYNMRKRVEHKCKSLQYEPMSISAIDPSRYAKRFIHFLERVFPEN